MKPKFVLLTFFALGVLMIGITIYYAATIDRAQRDIDTVVAPDGRYKAVHMRVYGDKPEPFCVDTIAIYLALYPESFVSSKRAYEVYGAPCAAPDKRAALPKIEWTSNKSVRITYATAGDKPPRKRDKDASLFVDIAWVKAN
ncbi:hypothetical protein [Undibacter mobilis]|uniref:Uncharacterized protein n=1 Tax=Undibacter mobilis TaxID=2292256 RepID=A0A371B8J7_9BRAD|nr:hypothetical protein [Undibacter mobilis]RDV03847.1 hypothetical protein DXH78_04160 [Undibacter mobilis]